MRLGNMHVKLFVLCYLTGHANGTRYRTRVTTIGVPGGLLSCEDMEMVGNGQCAGVNSLHLQ